MTTPSRRSWRSCLRQVKRPTSRTNGVSTRDRKPEDERMHDGEQREKRRAAPGAHRDAGEPHADGRRCRAAEGERDIAERHEAEERPDQEPAQPKVRKPRRSMSTTGSVTMKTSTASMQKATIRRDRTPSNSSGWRAGSRRNASARPRRASYSSSSRPRLRCAGGENEGERGGYKAGAVSAGSGASRRSTR